MEQPDVNARALMMFDAGKKSLVVAYLLLIFTGMFGGHRFYVGLTGMGVFVLVMTLLGLLLQPLLIIPAVVVIIDAFQLPRWIKTLNVELANQIAPPSPAPPPIATAAAVSNAAVNKTTSNAPFLWAAAVVVVLASLGTLRKSPSTPPSPQAISNAPQSLPWNAEITTAAIPASPPAEALPEIRVLSDMTGRYYAHSIRKMKPGLVRIVSKRDGPSGITYTHRECSCATATYKTLGTGETLKAMAASPADPGMSALVLGRDGMGSSSFHVCEHACTAIGARLDRSQTR